VADEELTGRAGKTAAGGNGAENAQLFQFHSGSLNN
jgi:hypothetical protein